MIYVLAAATVAAFLFFIFYKWFIKSFICSARYICSDEVYHIFFSISHFPYLRFILPWLFLGRKNSPNSFYWSPTGIKKSPIVPIKRYVNYILRSLLKWIKELPLSLIQYPCVSANKLHTSQQYENILASISYVPL